MHDFAELLVGHQDSAALGQHFLGCGHVGAPRFNYG